MTAELALITGASRGVGFAVAEQFARRGYDLIVADYDDEIHTAAAALTVLGTDVQAEQVPLCCADNAYLLHRRVMSAGRPVAVAALAPSVNDGSYSDGALDEALDAIESSVRGTMLLARLLAGRMALHGRGDIIVTAPPEDGLPGLGAAVHSASSALLQAFTEILQNDVSGSGVKVTALMPATIATAPNSLPDRLFALIGRIRANSAADVARRALETVARNDKLGIAAWATDAITTLAERLILDRARSPIRQIISPTGEAV